MKKCKIIQLLAVILVLASLMSVSVSAMQIDTKESYTYSYMQEEMVAPDSYILSKELNAKAFGVKDNLNITDIKEYDNMLYLLDSNSGKVFVLDYNYNLGDF